MYQPGGSPSSAGEKGSSPTGVSESQPAAEISGQHSYQSMGSEQAGGRPQEAGGPGTESPGQGAGEIREQAKEKMQRFAHRAREGAGTMFQRVRDQSETALSHGKDRAAEGMSRFAVAVLEAADRLRQEGDQHIAGYAEDISNQLDRAARYLQEHDLGGILSDLGHTVRRRPGLFFAGMFIGGLVAARFLKASRTSRSRQEQPYDQGADWAGGQSSGEAAVGGPGASAGVQTEGDVSGLPDDAMAMAGASPSPASPGISPGYGTSAAGTSPGVGGGPETSPSQGPPGYGSPSEKREPGPEF